MPLAKALDAQVVGLNVIDVGVVSQIVRSHGRRESEVLVEMEESGWKYLYTIEEMAVEQGVRIVLQQAQGFPADKVLQATRQLRTDLVVIGGKPANRGALPTVRRFLDEMLRHIECPVMVA